MTQDFSSFSLDALAVHLQAAQIHLCTPQTALRQVATEELRQWCQWQPGVLLRVGILSLAEQPACYFGGLSNRKQFFVFVPELLVEQRRRTLLFQLARERLATDDVDTLLAYCHLAEQQVAEDYSPRDHPALDAEARARQVSYWFRLLAYRQIQPTVDWRW